MATPDIAAVLSTLKSLAEITASIFNMARDADLKEKIGRVEKFIFSLQHEVVSIYAEYSKLVQVKNDHEKKLMEYENRDETESQYDLKEVTSDVFVYSCKIDNNISESEHEPPHWLCTNCFNNKVKSILQKHGGTDFYFCPKCKTEIRVQPHTPTRRHTNRGGPGSSAF